MRNLILENELVNTEADAAAILFNNGYLRIYTAGYSTLLAELRFAATAFAAAVAGVLTANSLVAEASAPAGGTAAAYRAYKSDGTSLLCSGTVGVQDSPNPGDRYDCELNTLLIQAGVGVTINSFTHTVPKQV